MMGVMCDDKIVRDLMGSIRIGEVHGSGGAKPSGTTDKTDKEPGKIMNRAKM